MNIFHRIRWEQWHLILAAIALLLIFSVFILVVIRILRTPKSKLDHLNSLPLEKENVSHERRNPPNSN
jgi:hypothetical protein